MAYTCPYCKMACFDNGSIKKTSYLSFEHDGIDAISKADSGSVVITHSKCPNCGKVAISLHANPYCNDDSVHFSYPPASAMIIPDYVPIALRSDYMEALALVELSPKASATLSRRCLQGMIHDFWKIKEKNLNAEITSLKGKIPTAQWGAIDALRKIGNIGAHMDKDVNLIVDVEPEESLKLLKLIELLVDKWYVARHDEEELLAEIADIGDQKEAERKSVSSTSNSQ